MSSSPQGFLDPASRAYRFTILAFAALMAFGSYFAYDSVGAIETTLIQVFHTDRSAIGTMYTMYSVAAVAEIMQRMNFTSAIVVSDGYHIFRVKKMLESRGLKVYGSPRPSIPPEAWREKWLYFKQAVAYVLWRVGISI